MTLHHTLARVISGAQTGVDIAALRVATLFHLPTGGAMPRGWRTLAGPRPEYREMYGMVEHASADWGPRTDCNVRDSDVTLRIAVDWESAGEKRTARACRNAGIEPIDIALDGALVACDPDVGAALLALRDMRACIGRSLVLNVAGNSEKTAPGIELAAMRVLWRVFSALCAPGRCAACGHPRECHGAGGLGTCSLVGLGRCGCGGWRGAVVEGKGA